VARSATDDLDDRYRLFLTASSPGNPVHDRGRYWTQWALICTKRTRTRRNTNNSGTEPLLFVLTFARVLLRQIKDQSVH